MSTFVKSIANQYLKLKWVDICRTYKKYVGIGTYTYRYLYIYTTLTVILFIWPVFMYHKNAHVLLNNLFSCLNVKLRA